MILGSNLANLNEENELSEEDEDEKNEIEDLGNQLQKVFIKIAILIRSNPRDNSKCSDNYF